VVVRALVAVQSDGVAWQLEDLDGGKSSNMVIRKVLKTNSSKRFFLFKHNTSDLVGAGVGHRPVVLGFVDQQGGLGRVCGSVRVRHGQTEKGQSSSQTGKQKSNNYTRDSSHFKPAVLLILMIFL